MEETRRICPLLMLAKAARRREETAPISFYCQGAACAWWRDILNYRGECTGGRCAILEISLKEN